MNPVSVEATAVPAVERELVPGQRWAGGGGNTPPAALCCGVSATRPLCAFCRRTVELIKAGRCVSCTAPIIEVDYQHHQGKCGDCLSRNERLCAATKRLLYQASKARYALKAAA